MAASSLAPGLARKVKKILEIKTETPELLNSLSTLSSFYTENTPAARRSLRTTFEKRGLAINEKFLSAAESVIAALDEVQGHLNALSGSCANISTELGSSRTSTLQLLGDTERLMRDLDTVQRKGTLVGDFLEQYQLTQEEVAALHGEEIGSAFFAALARVRQIHDNCRSLLRTHHQRAGLELMDMMATYQETAYERLCRWVQNECRNIGEHDAPEVDPLLQTAVQALRERPVLFKYCAEEVATARHNALFQRFITALTRGGPNGMPRPIEIHAHDPKRYINDMLAWVHQALASEREFVMALFGDDVMKVDEDGEMVSQLELLNSGGLMDRIFESICRPLKVRIEQVLMTSPPLLLCFELTQLHSFYYGLINKIIGLSSQLSQTLRSCRDMSQRVFFEQLKGRGDKLVRNPPPPPKNLAPPPQVMEVLHQLGEILSSYESAMHSSPDAAADEMAPVMAAVLDPLVEQCERSGEALLSDAPSRVDEVARLDPSAHRVYLINCLSLMHSVLATHPCAATRSRMLADVIEGHVSALVGGEVGRLLARCGLSEVVERLRLYTNQGGADSGATPASRPASDPALSLALVTEALRSFFISMSLPDTLPELPLLQVPRTRADAVMKIASSLADAYEMVYCALDNPTCGYLEQGGSSGVKHSPAQVRTILGVL